MTGSSQETQVQLPLHNFQGEVASLKTQGHGPPVDEPPLSTLQSCFRSASQHWTNGRLDILTEKGRCLSLWLSRDPGSVSGLIRLSS